MKKVEMSRNLFRIGFGAVFLFSLPGSSAKAQTSTPSPTPNCCQVLWSYPQGNTTFSPSTSGLAYDPSGPGTLYVGGVSVIQALNPANGATITTLPGTYGSITMMTRGKDGYLYVGDYNNQAVYKVSVPSGARAATISFIPYVDRVRSVFADDQSVNEDIYVGGDSNKAYKVTQSPTVVTALVFSPDAPLPARGDVSGILLQEGIAGTPSTLYLSDENNSRLLKYVQAAAGSVTYGYVATMNVSPILFPHQIVNDSLGNLYVCGASGYAAFDANFQNLWKSCGGGSTVPDTQGLALDGAEGAFLGSAVDHGALMKVGCPLNTPTLTPTYTSSPTFTPTPTITLTPTFTDTLTLTITYTFTLTPTPSETLTMTLTPTVTPTPTITDTPTVTNTPTYTPTNILNFNPTPTITSTPTPNPNQYIPYPNPNNGNQPLNFYYTLDSNAGLVGVKIFTVAFRKVFENFALPNTMGQHLCALNWGQANLSLANGLYYLVLYVETNGQQTRKVMKVLIVR